MKLLTIFAPIKIFFYVQFFGCNFLLRQIPYIGLFFWPLELFALPRIMDSKGVRFRRLLAHLGPTFIKFGQLLSARSDIVGEKLSCELSFLQDKLPSFSYRKVCHIIKKETGSTIENNFSYFAKEPVAAASIAQVHKAKTKLGDDVAVKILRPSIKKKFLSEVRLLYYMAIILNCFQRLKRLKLLEVVKLFEQTVEKELNLCFEAAQCSKLAENLHNNKNIIIPQIYWELTSEKIMVSEWVEGVKINQLQGKKEDLKMLGDNLVLCYYEQAYRDGYFHADMHPGNILITADYKIALIDFGIMGYLAKKDRIAVAQIVYGFIKRDYDLVAKIHKMAGYIPKAANITEFSLACRAIGEPIFGKNAKDISISKLMTQLFIITEKFGMQTQPQLLLLQKTLLLIEGVGLTLNPELNMWSLGEPFMTKWAKDNLSHKAIATDKLSELGEILIDLPEIIKKLKLKLDV